MPTKSSDWPMANTAHGMLVAFGEFLSRHGLIERLMQIPIGQKTRKDRPQTKLVEFLTGITSGMEHLEDLNDGSKQPHRSPSERRTVGWVGLKKEINFEQ